MSKSSSQVAMKDVVHKIQLCLLEGIKSETQLFVAGSLLSKSDYHDVVTERSIAQMCGYPLCPNSLPSSGEAANKGRYHISLKEHKVYDLSETRMYCSTKCVVDSGAYAESLEDERSLVLDTAKIDKVARLFEGLNVKAEEGLGDSGDFGLRNLSIKEKEDGGVGGGIVSLEEWIGPSNAIEGFTPQHDRKQKNRPGRKLKDEKLKREEERIFGEMDFMSSIITQEDGHSIGKEKNTRKSKSKNKERLKKAGNEGEIESRKDGVKSSLKSSFSTATSGRHRNVSWADDGEHNGTLCDYNQEKQKDDPLSNAAGCGDDGEEDVEAEPGRIKWPKKSGITETDFLESEDSWFDSPPEEFVLDVSAFGRMFMCLFAWVSCSTLGYVYGGDESCYLEVNGRAYPRMIVMPDGTSAEIKKTLAACLARALPPLVNHLRLPTPISTIESAMGCLLDTMSFVDALPSLRFKQWQLFVLLFLDALSVNRISAMAPHLTNTRRLSLFQKVFDDAQISGEEYEVLKDLILPLGRVPQLATQSGG
ncbi:hypothetical protein LXL04_039192 [Taraxacum kok-saghyz]